jgi:hypothetical protein
MSIVWTVGDVLEYVEHPQRKIRHSANEPENKPFYIANELGKLLNKFSAEDQEMYIENFIDTLDQIE